MNNITTTNGNGERHAETLPDHLQKQAESFFSNYLAREHELDVTKRELAAAHVRIREQGADLDGLRSQLAILESRVVTCVAERDQAVADRAVRETILASIQVLLVQAGVPRIVQLAEDETPES
jgi:alkylhydroperoxidase/carboxymuconolactone decarboxylase family protein YurZ